MRSGLGAQLGVATEAKYGEYKAPTRFLPFETESLSLDKKAIESNGLRGGRLVQAANLHRYTTRAGAGDFGMEWLDQGMGILLNQLHGEKVEAKKIEEKSKKVFKQLHPIGLTTPYGKSLTVQVGRPDLSNTSNPFTYLGCKVTEFKLSVDTGGSAMLSVSLDAQDEKLDKTLAEGTWDADTIPYAFQDFAVKLGGETLATARSFELVVTIASNTDLYHLGNKGLKSEPVVNDLVVVMFNTTLSFNSIADHKRYTEEKEFALESTATGQAIGSEGETFLTKISAPTVKQVSSSPTVQGPDVLTQDVSLKCFDNGKEAPLSIEYLSTDSEL